MQFPQVYKSKILLDIIIAPLKKDKDLQKMKHLFDYASKFQLILVERLQSILEKLPDYQTMNPYYELVSKNILEETKMDKYKNHYSATINVINKLSERYKIRIKKTPVKERGALKKEYIGRISSILRKLDKTNEALLSITKEFRNIPKPDMNAFTVCLVGLPNAGKTTLLTKLTEADPEINSYEFTTKSLNFGYFTKKFDKIQIVDTPGLVHLEFKKMNQIEKYAVAAIKTLADVLVYIYNDYLDEALQYEIYNGIKENNPDKKIYILDNIGTSKYIEDKITIEDILDKRF
jgi:nucleolar GTP-binding protein